MGATNHKDKFFYALFWVSGLIIVGILVSIIGYVAVKGIAAVNLEFLLQAPRRAGSEGGISTTIVGTLYLTVLALLL
ncbi:MAG TPA: phosphate ABC transporter, permease protein PstA, partial [Syntrophomonas sp.]|nr:phosphate ABC transporter, permease protein PstA [Syntrophomonas sp.]